jgi:hypothetical protein
LTQERDEEPRARALDLDAARQGVRPDVADMPTRGRVDDGEPAGTCIANSRRKDISWRDRSRRDWD